MPSPTTMNHNITRVIFSIKIIEKREAVQGQWGPGRLGNREATEESSLANPDEDPG